MRRCTGFRPSRISGKARGQVQVRTNHTGALVGSGEFELVDGSFKYYNQELNIERGRILFTEGPLNHPGVDIRVKKKVRGDSALARDATVGVDINGLLEDPQIHLFSDPYMEDVDILSYLVVGQEISGGKASKTNIFDLTALSIGIQNSSGNSYANEHRVDNFRNLSGSSSDDPSLALGRRVGKDLYISYDVSTFNQQGQFRIRYNLFKGFYVETKSSGESSGADFLYIFEH